jgi:CheY-like chemotaxis protein
MSENFRILIVDDDRRMTRTLADIFSLSGYEVTEAESGADALEKVNTMTFDCVLSDIKMPEMDGVELHRRLREIQPGLPVVLMTAYAASELISRGLEEGVAGVFDKPLDINHLLGFFTSLQRNQTIVVVDDDQAFCKTLDDILRLRGFKVTQITDPHVDVNSFAATAQVILLDLKFNGISGLDVLKEIRKNNPNLPVLMVTGHRQEMAPAIDAALQINAHACLYKPLEIPKLLQILADLQKERLRGLIKKR